MKQKLTLLFALFCSMSVWATYTRTYDKGAGGTFNSSSGWVNTWTSSDSAPVVTLSSSAGFNSGNGNMAANKQYTISVAGDYVITGYTIYTASGWGAVVTAETGETQTFSGEKTLSVTGLNTASTYFTISSGNNLNGPVITVSLEDKVSFDYTIAITGDVPTGTTFSVKGDAVTNGAYVSYGTAVTESDVVVTFPSGYENMAYDVVISASTITIDCYDGRWPVNFPRSQKFTRDDRHINDVTFTGDYVNQTIDGVYENTSTLCYQDLTATKSITLPVNTTITPHFNITGIWTHGFVYIDYNNDGDFTDSGELVSKLNEGNLGSSFDLPTFDTPSSEGTYRMRIKTDWASEDPGGNPGPSNYIIDNGGMIVDVTLNISADYTSVLTSITKPFTDHPAATGYFRMTSDNATSFLGMINTASTNDGVIDADEYDELMGYFNNFVRFPETGYYLIKNADSNRYLAYGTPGESGKAQGLITTEGGITPANIIKLTKQSGINNYTISSQGLNVQARPGTNNTFPMTADAGVNFSFIPQNATNLKIINADSYNNNESPGTLFEAHWTAPYAVVNWEPYAEQGQWTIEAATEVDIPLTAANDNTNAAHTYATLCVPFEITGLTGADAKEVKAYAPTKEDNAIVPGAGASTIAAGTPVILIGEEGATSVTATIGSGYAATPATTNILTGTFTGASIDCTAATGTDFVLGFDINNDNRIGFYHVDNTSFNLKANRAYLHSEGSGVKGFVIDFDDNATGIETMVNGQSSMVNEIYNLAGQRLQKAQKGINIINGKKILK